MSASPAPRQASDAGKEMHALSCSSCRQRKVKCSKTYPCPNCVRSGLACLFPTRKKDRRPRTNRNHELLNRLAKLEAIVGQVDPDAVSASPAHPPVDASPPPDAAEGADKHVAQSVMSPAQRVADAELRNPQKRCPTSQPVSKDDPAAKYVSGEFWANLAREVEGIKATLEQPSDEEDDDDGEFGGPSPGSQYQSSHGSLNYSIGPPAVLGNASAVAGLSHPPPPRMKTMCAIYFRNVDPLMKILHKPTVEKVFDSYIMNPADHSLGRTTEALLFAMYFGAVTSMQPDSCMRQLGEDRRLLSVQYKQAVEHALARADYLNSTSLETLQAFMIYSVSSSGTQLALCSVAGATTNWADRLVYATMRNLAPRGRYWPLSCAWLKPSVSIATAMDPPSRLMRQRCGAGCGHKSLFSTSALPKTVVRKR